MQFNEVPFESSGPEDIEIAFQPPVSGWIISERFLIDKDLSDPALAGRFSSHRVKDLRHFCREAVLNIVNFTPVIDTGPSFHEVSTALLQVSHPNIENVIECGTLSDGRAFSLTEQAIGDRLEDLIRDDRRLDLEDAARVIEQTAEGLAAAHRKRLLHCDLRPQNIIVNGDGRPFSDVIITSFGAAWPIDVRGHGFVHLPSESECFIYAAPEVFAKLGHRSIASDIYSLAVIAYRLITGRLPFEFLASTDLAERVSREEWVPPTELRTDLSFETENVLFSGLRFEPAKRPQNVEDFAFRLVSSLRPSLFVTRMEEERPSRPIPIEPATVIEVETALPEPVAAVEERVPGRPPRRMPAIVSDRAVTWVLIILLLAGALSIPIVQKFLKEEKAEAAVGTMLDRTPEDRSKRELRFWIESRSTNAAVPISEALNSRVSNAHISLISGSVGDVYVIGETTGADGRIAYRLLSQQGENEVIQAGKVFRTVPIDFNSERVFWIIWTGRKFPDLDSNLPDAVSEKPLEGSINRLRHFLERNRNLRLEATERGNEVVLNGIGDRIVYRLSLPEN